MTAQPDTGGIFPTKTSTIPVENVASSSATTLDVTDAITSLRDAALKTLRSKRKKATNEVITTLPVRPLPSRAAAAPTSVMLDYGSEDQPFSNDTEERKASSSKLCGDDAREEGEISDEEGSKPVEPTTSVAKDEPREGFTRGIFN